MKLFTLARYLSLCFILACILFGSYTSLAVQPYRMPPYTSYDMADGLSQISVYDIEQDRQGMIWLATQAGIDRFDGYEFTNFTQRTDSKDGLLGSFVFDITLNHETGDLYLATPQAVNIYREKTARFDVLDMPVDYLNSGIQKLYIDDNNGLWIGTREGVFYTPNEAEAPVRMSNIDALLSINDISEDTDGNIWIASSIGLFVYTTTNEWKIAGFENKEVRSLLFKDKELWIGTNSDGLYVAQLIAGELRNMFSHNSQNSAMSNTVTDISAMRDDSIWVATAQGISVFQDANTQPQHFELADESGVSAAITLTDLHETDSGVVIFGTDSKGFGVIDRNALLFDSVAFPQDATFIDITKQDKNHYWVSSDVGIWKLDNEHKYEGPFNAFVDKDNRLSNLDSTIDNLHFSPVNKRVYVATRNGLGLFDQASKQTRIIAFEGKQIYAVESGWNGNLFVSTRNHGLYYFNPQTLDILYEWDIPLVTTFFVESSSRVWVSGLGGLNVLDTLTGDIHRFLFSPNESNSLPSKVITWISQSKKGEYLIGTHNRGIATMQFDPKSNQASFQTILQDSELSHKSIGAIVEDDLGHFWVSTSDGIAKISPDLDEVQFYDGYDGANWEGYYINSFEVSDSGKIYFVGPSGITHFYPENVKTQDLMPPLVITHIEKVSKAGAGANNAPKQAVGNGQYEPLILGPQDLMFTISFAALEYGSPSKIEYSYRLLGLDERWRYTNSEIRKATFTTLSPGEYTLEIRSTNRYGNWNPAPITLDIIVNPPWWKTNVFISLMLLLSLLIIFGLYKWRTLALRMQSKLLADKVVEKTMELQSANLKLKQLATIDPLTNVFNRRGFKEAAEALQAVAADKHKEIGLLLIDIDKFKSINDTHGHDVGDKILVHIAETLSSRMRKNDVLARWGGEEFIAMIAAEKADEIAMLAEGLRDYVQQHPFISENSTIAVSVTIGGVKLKNDMTLESAIKQADILLYEGKSLGRNMSKVRLD